MANRNFIPLVPSGTINADASVAQLEQDVLAMDAKVGELAEDIGDTEQEISQLKSQITDMVAGEETSTTAAHAYTAGDYFLLGGKLYIALTSIAVSDTLTVGRNIAPVTLTGQIEGLEGKAGVEIDITDTLTISDGKAVNASNGATSGSTPNYSRWNMTGCAGFDYIKVTLPVLTSATTPLGLAFYTTSATSDFDSGVYCTHNAAEMSYETKIIPIPLTANFVRATWFSSNGSYKDTFYPHFHVSLIKTGTMEKEITDLQNPVTEYSAMSLFETVGVIGDSLASGAVYGVTGATNGEHYGISWPQIMARRNGITATNYSKAGLNTAGWLSDGTYGLAKLLSDEPLNLYYIALGTNSESTLGTIEDVHEDFTENPDSMYGNYARIIGNIMTHAPSAKIICIRYASSEKRKCISDVAEYYGVPTIEPTDDWYFSTDFWNNNKSTSHPIGPTYAGQAVAFERLTVKCIVDNIAYFKNYTGND